MTRAYLELDGDRCTLVCRGHATGSEAMCAAVSCLAYTAAGWARNHAQVHEERLEDGEACLCFSGAEARTVFQVLRIGLLQLAASDPERLQAEISEVE